MEVIWDWSSPSNGDAPFQQKICHRCLVVLLQVWETKLKKKIFHIVFYKSKQNVLVSCVSWAERLPRVTNEAIKSYNVVIFLYISWWTLHWQVSWSFEVFSAVLLGSRVWTFRSFLDETFRFFSFLVGLLLLFQVSNKVPKGMLVTPDELDGKQIFHVWWESVTRVIWEAAHLMKKNISCKSISQLHPKNRNINEEFHFEGFCRNFTEKRDKK